MRTTLTVIVAVLITGLLYGCSAKLEIGILERYSRPVPSKEETATVKRQTTSTTVETSEVTK